MRQVLLTLAIAALCACSPGVNKGDPRDRKGDVTGTPVWGVVQRSDSVATFLARPGTAPDLVLWCRSNAEMILRAHVFQNPPAVAELFLTTTGGSGIFLNVRKQGGIRSGDRTLVEGVGILPDPKFQAVIKGASKIEARSGTETYVAENADPNNVMAGFVASCLALPPPTQSPLWKSAK